jgi:tetratricopeptide (TPR) repeat protein
VHEENEMAQEQQEDELNQLLLTRFDETIDSISGDDPVRLELLSRYAVLNLQKYERNGQLDDLNEAISKQVQAVEDTAEGDPELAGRLSNLVVMLQRRFERTGRMEDLEESIQRAQQAVKDTAENDPELAGRLNNLGATLQRRFERTGRIEDLKESVQLARQVVENTAKNDPKLAGRLNNLGVILQKRFERTGRMKDLEESIQRAQQAVDVTPPDHPDLAGYLSNLGNCLRRRFERTGKMEDLEESIQRAQQAVDVTPPDHPDLAAYLNNLGNKLESRFETTGKMEDLEESIRQTQQAVKNTAKNDPELASRLNNLSNKFESRFKRTGRMEDLEESIRRAQQAVDVTPQDHPNLAGWLYTFGRCLGLSSQLHRQDQALEAFRRSWNCVSGIPFHRLRSAIQAIRSLKQRSDWSEALNIAEQATNLLPLMNNRSLSRDDQQYVVSAFSGLAADACSLVLQTGGDAFEALELLELGRGVIMGLLMDDRSDISALEQSHPEQAAVYDRLRSEVNSPMPEVEEIDQRRASMARHLEAVHQLDECISSIRQLSGHERFLLGPTLDDLKEWASEGPIVVVNMTDIRSDAIIVTSAVVTAIRLPQLTEADAVKWIDQDLTTYHNPEEKGKKNKRYTQFLSWLWSSCVEVILHRIHNGKRPTPDSLPRIWWIGVGIANSLPFHAAGTHSIGSTMNTLHWAISSYTPTIKALIHARKRASAIVKTHNGPPRLLVVTMPQTLGEQDLPGVEREGLEVQMAVQPTFSSQSLVQPDARSVMKRLVQCDMLHFAGHGMSDHADPFNSSLMLQEADGALTKVDKLSVRQISDVQLKEARIAYLSACSTAENRSQKLVDEVIHLASGFQVAGFSDVIASMWSTDDDICVQMARGFYERLKDSYGNDWDKRAVAAAVHDSMMEIRSTKWRYPLLWAPYVHLGA